LRGRIGFVYEEELLKREREREREKDTVWVEFR